MILGCSSDGVAVSQLMCVDARAVAAATAVTPEPVPETAGAHIFAAHETESGYVID